MKSYFHFFHNVRSVASLVVAFCLVSLLIFSLSPPSRTFKALSPTSPTPVGTQENDVLKDQCDGLSNVKIQVVVKTGANVIYDKLPVQLMTALRCCPHLLLLSDLEQKMGPYQVHDVLDNVTESAKSAAPEFEYYRLLQEYQKYGQDIRSLRQTSAKAGWNLDKYKFVHMLDKAWTLRPGQDWYVFVEADTYLVWSNLVQWLERKDPSKSHYLGSPTYWRGEGFAHGGSGIILSRGAMAKVLDDKDITARYDEVLQHEGLGDYVLMKALTEKGVELSKAWPMIQGEKQTTIPFGPSGNLRLWCQPLITMHGVTSEDVNAMWQFEQQRVDRKKPLLIEEMYDYFMSQGLAAEREDWDNGSDDVMYRAPGVEGDRQKSPDEMTHAEKEAYQSFEKCGQACEENHSCFQYRYFQETCGIYYSYRLGSRKVPDEDGVTYKSGWMLDRIAHDRSEHPCTKPEWL